jgi:hypothetical protein
MEGQGAELAVRIDDSLIPSFIASFCSTRLENLLLLSLFSFWGAGREGMVFSFTRDEILKECCHYSRMKEFSTSSVAC